MNQNMLQALVDGLNAQAQHDRAQQQMTLGGLIAALETLDPDRFVVGFGRPISYRGYYCDLAFTPSDEPRTVADLLRVCREDCMGQVFVGYKGGDFVMGALTPLWIAGYGQSGSPRLMGLDTDADPIAPITAREHDDE